MCRLDRTLNMVRRAVLGQAGQDAKLASIGAGLLRFQGGERGVQWSAPDVETSKPGKLPLEFAIAHLSLKGIRNGDAMGFEAELTNPRPVGTIHTSKGSFGPWQVDDPGESPITGDYRFECGSERIQRDCGDSEFDGPLPGHAARDGCGWRNGYAGFPADALRHRVAAAHEVPCSGGRDQRRHMAGAGGSDAGTVALLDAGTDCEGAPVMDGQGWALGRARYRIDGECRSRTD
jgi:hypothetical protein